MAMERENRAPRAGGPNRKRKKVCQFCVDKCEYIDYKDAAKLRRFISERSKILPRHQYSCQPAALLALAHAPDTGTTDEGRKLERENKVHDRKHRKIRKDS